MQTAWIGMRCRVPRRLIRIQAFLTLRQYFHQLLGTLKHFKNEADEKYNRCQYIWPSKGLMFVLPVVAADQAEPDNSELPCSRRQSNQRACRLYLGSCTGRRLVLTQVCGQLQLI